MHSTNYFNTLIENAEDSTTPYRQVPPSKAGKRSIANLQYELLADRPYQRLVANEAVAKTKAMRSKRA